MACRRCARIGHGRRSYSFKQKPKTHDQFKQSHGCIENVIVNDFVEVRENEKNESTEHTPGGRDDAKERQADIIIIETPGELHPRECLQAVGFENLQVTRVAEKPKRRQTVERRNEPQHREDESKQCAGQGKTAIYWFENNI